MTDMPAPVRPQDCQVSREALQLVPREQALQLLICPLALTRTAKGDRELVIACEHPDDLQQINYLRQLFRCYVRPVPASARDISLGIAFHYGLAGGNSGDVFFTIDDVRPTAPPKHKRVPAGRVAESPSVTQQVTRILETALARRATDIHFEPHEHTVYVRFRVDGILTDATTYPIEQHPQIAARIKVLCNLDVAQNRLPQDGRFEFKHDESAYDIRASYLPTVCGECVVLRLLPKGTLSITFDDLGLTAENCRLLDDFIHAPSGMVLLTGPTGSGKTTTLYACLSRVDSIARKVATIEDPVEYQFHRVAQTQVNPRIGLTFAAGLRSVLRQDPDIIMVGEIRDLETLEIAVHSALTGHLVLSTLHCNDASAAAARMVDMGAEPFLIASSVGCIAAQRLVRRLCPACKEPLALDPAARAALGLPDDATPYFHGRGCRRCAGTGYYGRTSVFEMLPITEEIAAAIAARASAGDIRRLARARGIRSLREDGLDKARAGVTTVEEVLHAINVEPG